MKHVNKNDNCRIVGTGIMCAPCSGQDGKIEELYGSRPHLVLCLADRTMAQLATPFCLQLSEVPSLSVSIGFRIFRFEACRHFPLDPRFHLASFIPFRSIGFLWNFSNLPNQPTYQF